MYNFGTQWFRVFLSAPTPRLSLIPPREPQIYLDIIKPTTMSYLMMAAEQEEHLDIQGVTTGLSDDNFIVTPAVSNINIIHPNARATLWLQLFDANALTPEANQVYLDADQWNARNAVASLEDGGFVVIATSTDSNPQIGNEILLLGWHFDAAGNQVGEPFEITRVINQTGFLSRDTMHITVSGLSDGGFITAWQSDGVIFGKRFNAACVAVGDQLQISPDGSDYCRHPSVTGHPDGGFVVIWESGFLPFEDDGYPVSSIVGRRYGFNGYINWDPSDLFWINTQPLMTFHIKISSLAVLTDGSFIVNYLDDGGNDNYDTKIKRFSPYGSELGDEVTLNRSSYHTYFSAYLTPSIASLPDGAFVVAWKDLNSVYVQRFIAPEQIFETTNTPLGDSIETSFLNDALTITFDSVSVEGETTVSPQLEGIALPANFQIFNQSFDISTTATFDGQVEICFTYDDTGVTLEEEQILQLLHFDIDHWENVTSSLDVDNNIICGTVFHFSEFAIVVPPENDVDGDGVPNEDDLCEMTPIGKIVNPSTGCAIEQLCPCNFPMGTTTLWKNHGKYVSCVAKTSESFVEMSLISEIEKDAIVSDAAQSECGVKK